MKHFIIDSLFQKIISGGYTTVKDLIQDVCQINNNSDLYISIDYIKNDISIYSSNNDLKIVGADAWGAIAYTINILADWQKHGYIFIYSLNQYNTIELGNNTLKGCNGIKSYSIATSEQILNLLNKDFFVCEDNLNEFQEFKEHNYQHLTDYLSKQSINISKKTCRWAYFTLIVSSIATIVNIFYTILQMCC